MNDEVKLHIQELYLNNFHCFEKLSLKFHKHLNVFFGENGAGKSSIFEAINILLGLIIDKLGKNTAVKTVISYQDILNSSKTAEISLSMHDKNTISWGLSSQKTIKNGDFSSETRLHCEQLEEYVKKIIDSILENNSETKLPIFVSYKATRNTEYFYDKNEHAYKLTLQACYDDAISMNFDYSKFFKWFKEREDLELQKKSKDSRYIDNQLEAVRNAVRSFGSFSSFSFDREVWNFVLSKNDKQVYFNQLSDGERGYLLLMGDIARRLAIANPNLTNPLEGEGIILIDEIELHLHPKWQRMIVPRLLETFPNCQFIVTSHSPQVLGEIEDTHSIWILEEGKEPYHPQYAYGLTSSEALDCLMGAESRNTEVTTELERIDRLIDDEDFDVARAAIRDLVKKTGKIPAIYGANSYLTMMGQEQVDIEG